MKIQYASDLHLEFKENWNYLKHRPLEVAGEILVLAGDIGYLGDENYSKHPFWDWVSDNYKQVIVALGNHEFYKYYDIASLNNGDCGSIRSNVKFYYNSVIQIDSIDIVVSTLWSHIDLKDAFYIENGVSDFKRIMYGDDFLTFSGFNAEHRRCLDFIKSSVKNSNAKTNIVVTHHVPSYKLCSNDFIGSHLSGAFVVELADYIADSGIDYWIYGHSHRNISTVIGHTQCLSNQLGYVFCNEHTTFRRNSVITI